MNPQAPQTPPPFHTPAFEDAWEWRSLIVRRILQISSGVGFIALAASFFAVSSHPVYFLYAALYVALLIITFGPNISAQLQTYAVLTLVYALGIMGLAEDGLSGDGRVALLALPILAVALLGRRAGAYALGLAVFTLGTFAVLFGTGLLAIQSEASISSSLANWISATAVFTLLAAVALITQSALLPRFLQALAQIKEARLVQEKQTTELEKSRAMLQQQTRILEMNADILKEAQNARSLKDFLDEAVRHISTHYGIYHAGIFLLDEDGEHAELRAASSVTGQNMVSTKFSLQIGQAGTLTETLRAGRPQVIAEVQKNTDSLVGPQLIEAHSEMLLPLRIQDTILGALDLQNREAFSFGEEDLAAFQNTAALLSLSIHHLGAAASSPAQRTTRADQRTAGPDDWKQFVRARGNWGYRYDPTGITPLGHSSLPASPQDAAAPELSIPITMRDKVVGVIKAHKPTGLGHWNQDETALMKTLADQLSVALESARLFEETQRRAAQERLVGEVTSQMRQSLDVDTVLRTAVSQIRQALNLESAEVHLEVGPASQPVTPEGKTA